MSLPSSRAHIHFGVFEVDPAAGELRKHGIRIHLQEQPLQVLLTLLEKPGELVTRQELCDRIWCGDTFVDFDQSLNRAINKIREALGDVSDNPRFIETLPKRGYRFIAPVEGTARLVECEPPRPLATGRRWIRISGIAVAALAVAASLFTWFSIPAPPPFIRLRRITTDSEPKAWPAVSDGSRIYLITEPPEAKLLQFPISGGRATRLAFALAGSRAVLQDVSPDAQEILLTADDPRTLPATWRTGPAPLWAVRTSDGSARRLGTVRVYSARYSPEGSRIAWSTDDKLYIAAADSSVVTEIASMPGWSLDVRFWKKKDRIILTCSEKNHPVPYAWEIAPDGAGLRRILPHWERPHEIVGFTPDGRFMLLLSGGALWSVRVPRWQFMPWRDTPAQITFGTPSLSLPFGSRDGRLFAQGVVQLGELQRFDRSRGIWQRHLDGISADGVEHSPDGQWVAYCRYPDQSLWRCRANGTQCLQLADGRIGPYLPHWSPDGKTIAFIGSVLDSPRIWLVGGGGDNLRLAAPGYAGPQFDPAWTADGKIIFASGNLAGRSRSSLQILDISSGKAAKIPGTDGFFSPRSSPDFSRLLALSSDKEFPAALVIRDPVMGQWQKAGQDYTAFPNWAPDNRSIIYHNSEAIYRVRLDKRTLELIAPIDPYSDIRANLGMRWLGQDAGGAPLVMRNRDVSQFYEIEVVSKSPASSIDRR